MKEQVQFVRLVGNERRAGESLSSISRHWQGEKESFMIVSPHDDDAVLGAGLLIQLAQRENVPVYIIIVTDGSMGYCSFNQKESIAKIRQQETFEAYESLGVPRENIIWLGYPDCQINNYRGRSKSNAGEKLEIKGFKGLQNSFTYYLRKISPTQCFLPTCNDLHPDHRIVYDEFLISVFHAGGDIWPELGEPLRKIPYIHEAAVYCDFSSPPTLRITTPKSYLDNKLNAISFFRSQKQISSLVENVRSCGAQEYIKSIIFGLYRPEKYYNIFEEYKAS